MEPTEGNGSEEDPPDGEPREAGEGDRSGTCAVVGPRIIESDIDMVIKPIRQLPRLDSEPHAR